MQINISLSNKEKKHYFLYLLGMLLIAVIVLSVILLRKYKSPFAVVNYDSVSTLVAKQKFDKNQDHFLITMDSTFSKIDKLSPENTASSLNTNIKRGIDDIENSLKNADVQDSRKEGYIKIAKFYRMYYNDKVRMQVLLTNIKTNNENIQRCNTDYENKRNKLGQ